MPIGASQVEGSNNGINAYMFPVIGVFAAIAITTTMDATGLSAASALPLFPLAGLLWALQRFTRQEIGLTIGRPRHFLLALFYPMSVLGAAVVIALIANVVDMSEAKWNNTGFRFMIVSSVGTLMVMLTEEGFFRGWLWASLKKTGQSDLAVLVVTSVAFTLWHVSAISLDTGFDVPTNQIPVFLVNATLLGFIWGALRLISGSILVASLSHAVWNASCYLLFSFGEKVGKLGVEETEIYGPEVGVVGIALNLCFAAFMVWLLWFKKAHSVDMKTPASI